MDPTPLAFAFAAAALLTPVGIFLAKKFHFLDHPDGGRKNHARPTPYGGGAVVFAVFAAVAAGAGFFADFRVLALGVGAGLALAIGSWDDARPGGIPGKIKLLALGAAALVPMTAGIGIDFVTDPWTGGTLDLALWQISLPGGAASLPADFLTIFWLVGMAVAMDFVDGVHGLSSGIAAIGAATIAALSLALGQTEIAVLAGIFAAAAGGFLPWHFLGKIFPGDGGAFFYGFLLAGLAILSGTKVAAVAVAAALPILDAVIVVARRVARGRSPFAGGRDHLHFLLTDRIGPRGAVLAMWGISILAGAAALFFQTTGKIAVFFAIGVGILAAVFWLARSPDR